MEFHEYISWIATLTSVCVQLIGVQICMKFVRRGTTTNVSCVPFTAQFISSCVWIRYAMMAQLPAVLAVNVINMLLQFCYIVCYYVYTLHKSALYRQLVLAMCSMLTVLAYIKYYVRDETMAMVLLGLLGCVMTTLSYAAPLATIADVVRTKCTETVSFPLVCANFIASVEWSLYGIIIKNPHIGFPNSLGVILTLLQLTLFICYPSSRPQRSVIHT